MNTGGAEYEEEGSGATAGYGATDPGTPDRDAVGRGDDMGNDELLDEENSTAPDSETQSGAASSSGGRTTEEGSDAPEMPAEG